MLYVINNLKEPIINITKNTSLSGIEYLRVCLSVFVIAWHMGIAGKSNIFSKTEYLHHAYRFSDFLNFQVFLVAVPAFMLISSYLYIKKSRDNLYLFSRIKKLILLAIILGVLFNIHWYISTGNFRISNTMAFESFITTIFRAGNTPYYFFISLSINLIMTHMIRNIKTRLLFFGFIVTVLGLALLPIIAQQYNNHYLIAFWNPLNFTSYPFLAILLFRKEKVLLKYFSVILFLSLSCTVVISILEWQSYLFKHTLESGLRFPAYTRVSLIISTFILLLIALKFKPKSNKVISFMSLYSLALYAIHPFLIWPHRIFTVVLVSNKVLNSLINFIFIILLSYFIAWVLQKYIKNKLLF